MCSALWFLVAVALLIAEAWAVKHFPTIHKQIHDAAGRGTVHATTQQESVVRSGEAPVVTR